MEMEIYEPTKKTPKVAQGGVWVGIYELINTEDEVTKTFIDKLQIQVGDGAKMKFGEHLWVKEGRLKDKFPNMYRTTTGLVLPRLELLTWFVILRKLNAKDRLFELGLIKDIDAGCVLCGDE
ncbi:hypothetical protein PIB30_009184 [Stylosanthes scabra]|uniref:Uncharacterized protein n=1 Tax=Stylosanthes scabra TaxID=79078 RepID=A0ABU6Y6V7_9FABA|nr:hypothetical protein [Stylosanthes scabra]